MYIAHPYMEHDCDQLNLFRLETSLPFMLRGWCITHIFHEIQSWPTFSLSTSLSLFSALYLCSLNVFLFYYVPYTVWYHFPFLFKITLKLILTWYESKSHIVNGAVRWKMDETNSFTVVLTFYVPLNKQLNNQLGLNNFQKWIQMEDTDTVEY